VNNIYLSKSKLTAKYTYVVVCTYGCPCLKIESITAPCWNISNRHIDILSHVGRDILKKM